MQVLRLPANFKLGQMRSHKHSLAARYSFKMAASKFASFGTNVFWIACMSGAEISEKGKT